MAGFETLIGRKIDRIFISYGEGEIAFLVEGNEYHIYEVDGDCCSQSWFSDIYNLSALRGAIVREVAELELPEYNTYDGRGRQSYDQVYGYAITTNKGTAVIAFRNSSNGYYGGSLCTGAVREYEGFREDYTELTGDEWSA